MIKIKELIEPKAALNIRWCNRNFTLREYRFYVNDGEFVHVFKDEETANFFLLSREVNVISVTKIVDDNIDNNDSNDFYKHAEFW